MTTRNVTLPDGRTVPNVPDSVSNAGLIDILLSDGSITSEEGKAWLSIPSTAQQTKEANTPPSGVQLPSGMEVPVDARSANAATRVGGTANTDALLNGLEQSALALRNNLDIPGGFAGAAALAGPGAALGTAAIPIPGVGTAVGALGGVVVGGALGTFGGDILSDWFAGEDADFSEATKDAAISAGFDVATFGAAKLAKPVMGIMKLGKNELFDVFRKTAKPSGDVLQTGSDASLTATQKLLQEGATDPSTGQHITSSLTAYQSGKARGVRRLAEGIGEVGFFSGGRSVEQTRRAGVILDSKLDTLMDGAGDVASGEIGYDMLGVIKAGKAANSALRIKALTAVQNKLGREMVSPSLLRGTMESFRRKHQLTIGSELKGGSLKLLAEWEARFAGLKSIPASELLNFQKIMNSDISELADFGQLQNTPAASQLADLADNMRKTIQHLLDTSAPNAGAQYKAANAAFKEGIDSILPKINATTITRANNADYGVIAQVLHGSNAFQIKAFMKSIDTSFIRAEQAGVDMFAETGFKSAEHIKDVVRRGYIENIFAGVVDRGKLARKFDRLVPAKAAKEVLGAKGFVQLKRLLNAMAETSGKAPDSIGTLVLRSKEIGTLTPSLLLVGGATAAGGSLAALGTAATVFLTPVMLGRIAGNPKAITALLSAEKAIAALLKAPVKDAAKRAATINASEDIMLKAFDEIWNMFSPEEQGEIRNSARGFDLPIIDSNTLEELSQPKPPEPNRGRVFGRADGR